MDSALDKDLSALQKVLTNRAMPAPIPPGWPGSLPDPNFYPSATFRGMREWCAFMDHRCRLIMLKEIFNEDGNRTLRDDEWLGLVNVRSIFSVYLATTNADRAYFGVFVRCTSAPPVETGPPDEGGTAGLKPASIGGVRSAIVAGPKETWFDDGVFDPNELSRIGKKPFPEFDLPEASATGRVPASRIVGQPLPSDGNPDRAGYCYLHLVVPSARPGLGTTLRANPWASAVAGHLLDNPGICASGRFQLHLGLRHVTAEGPNYTQAHIIKADNGLKVTELLARLAGTMRLGMATSDLNALVNLQDGIRVPAKPLAFDERPRGPSISMNVGVHAMVGADQKKYPNFQWGLFTTPVFVAMFGIYESVRLESAEFTVDVDKGATNQLFCAITGPGVKLNGDEWYIAPVNTVIHGSDQGSVHGTFSLPRDTPFAREVRTKLPGNPPPAFHFGYVGAPETAARISGRISVTCSGQAMFSFIDIGGPPFGTGSKAKAFNRILKTTRHVTKSVGYDLNVPIPTVGEEDSEEEDSDDDDEPAVASTGSHARSNAGSVANSSPPKVNANVSRVIGK